MKNDLTTIFIDEIYSKVPKKNYPTNKIIYNHIEEIWSIDLADFSDYKISNNEDYRYVFVTIDTFSKNLWAIPLKSKISQTMSQEFSFILTTSKRSPVKVERDRGKEWYNSIQNLLKTQNIHHFPRFTDNGPSKVERLIRTIRNLLEKLIFSAGNADCLSELSAVVKQYNNSFHHSVEMTPFQASKKSNEKKSFLISKTIEKLENQNSN